MTRHGVIKNHALAGELDMLERATHPGQVNGRLIVPAAVMLEMAMAAMTTLMDTATAAVLASVSISTPMLLPALAQHSHVEVVAAHMDGSLEVRSAAAGSGGRRQVHCRGTAARLLPAAAAGGPLQSLLPPSYNTRASLHPRAILHLKWSIPHSQEMF